MRQTDDTMADILTRVSGWLQAWDNQGLHRTGTDGDEAGALWLAGEVSRLGARAASEYFVLDRIDTEAAFVATAHENIAGEMLFDAPDTDAAGITARASIGTGLDRPAEAPLHVLTLSPHAVYSPEFTRFRQATQAQALIVVTKGAEPGLALLNAEAFRHPFGPPILQIPEMAAAPVIAAAQAGATLHVVIRSRRTPARARNIVVTLPGLNRDRKPLVVMTPRSSWWQSTAERGGGLVCWLEALRALRADPPGRDVVFTANSGHELGHIGLDDFVARRPGWDRADGASWIHYGANIGAAGGALSIMSNADDLRLLFQTDLIRTGRAADIMADKDHIPSGETRDIHKLGGHYLTLVGTNRLFHLPQDRWPHAVDTDAIARIAAGAARAILALCR